MSDTARTDKAVFSLGFPCESEKVVQADFARKLERENAELRRMVGKFERNYVHYGVVLIASAVTAIVVLLNGCTLGNETPAERRDRSRWENGSPWSQSWEFRNGRWEEVK